MIDTDTDRLETVVATLSAAYAQDVTVAGPAGGRGRSTSPRRSTTGRRRRRKPSGPTSADVREWAAANGMTVSPRGRLSTALWDQYRAAH